MRVKSRMVARIEPGIPAAEVLASGLRLDRDATVAVASQWFRSGVLRRPRYQPTDELAPIDAVVAPSRGEVFVGTFPGVTIATAAELATDRPSELAARFREPAGEALTFIASVEPDKDLVAFGTWVGERLTRSLSIRGDQKAIEDLGARRAPEMPYWDHQRNVPREPGTPAPRYPFDPFELVEAVRRDLLGFGLIGSGDTASPVGENDVDPSEVELLRFVR